MNTKKAKKMQAKKKPGRPFSDNPRLLKLSSVRVSDDELTTLQETAVLDDDSITFSAWVRRVLFQRVKRVRSR